MGAYRSVPAGGVYGYTRLLDEQDLPVGGQWPVVMRDGAFEAVRVVPHLDHRRPHIVVDVAGLINHGIAALLLILFDELIDGATESVDEPGNFLGRIPDACYIDAEVVALIDRRHEVLQVAHCRRQDHRPRQALERLSLDIDGEEILLDENLMPAQQLPRSEERRVGKEEITATAPPQYIKE